MPFSSQRHLKIFRKLLLGNFKVNFNSLESRGKSFQWAHVYFTISYYLIRKSKVIFAKKELRRDPVQSQILFLGPSSDDSLNIQIQFLAFSLLLHGQGIFLARHTHTHTCTKLYSIVQCTVYTPIQH